MSYDKHFAELAKDLKAHQGFVNWSVVVKWYNKHYVSVTIDGAHLYIIPITNLVIGYMDRRGLLSLTQLVETLCPNFDSSRYTFSDLPEKYNDKMEYKILAQACGKLILTECKKIPHFYEIE